MKAKFFLITAILLVISTVHLSFTSIKNQYILDSGHTFIGFDVERFMVGEVSGRFNEFTGNMTLDNEDFTTLKVEITINASSIDTNHETRDRHLKGGMWLDTENYPEIKFISTQVAINDNGEYIMVGNFTIKGVTKVVEFPVKILGPFMDPTKKMTLGIKADFEIDRSDYGIKFNKKMDNGSFFIDNKVKIKIRSLAYRK
ncbi:YceI family protein [uncultured Aquimarina sp.]|uniref:YceI family protein n=1 Tax=uncultured Aquimarina sp. TaxID=575652 RepID=UPI0026045C33|nr:YceI family protein [uncultured Aquimarina sp.]